MLSGNVVRVQRVKCQVILIGSDAIANRNKIHGGLKMRKFPTAWPGPARPQLLALDTPPEAGWHPPTSGQRPLKLKALTRLNKSNKPAAQGLWQHWRFIHHPSEPSDEGNHSQAGRQGTLSGACDKFECTSGSKFDRANDSD